MAEKPSSGHIVIEWRRIGDSPPDDFDWRVELEPPGLPDEKVSRLLGEIAERIEGWLVRSAGAAISFATGLRCQRKRRS